MEGIQYPLFFLDIFYTTHIPLAGYFPQSSSVILSRLKINISDLKANADQKPLSCSRTWNMTTATFLVVPVVADIWKPQATYIRTCATTCFVSHLFPFNLHVQQYLQLSMIYTAMVYVKPTKIKSNLKDTASFKTKSWNKMFSCKKKMKCHWMIKLFEKPTSMINIHVQSLEN